MALRYIFSYVEKRTLVDTWTVLSRMTSAQGKTVHITWASQKGFPDQSACVNDPHATSRFQFLNKLLVLFILKIILSKVNTEQSPIYDFQWMLPSSNISYISIYILRHFKYLTEKTECKREKG